MKKTFSGSQTEADALNTYLKLFRAAEKISVATHRHLTEAGLTSSQFAVLEACYHLGPLSQREIARKILKSHGNVTLVISNLEQRGLVERQRNQEDRRFYSVKLTGQGEALIEKVFPRHVYEIVRSLSPLTAAEQHELARLCRKLGMN